MNTCEVIITVSKRSSGKVMFLHMCHSVHSGLWYHFLSGPMFLSGDSMMALPVWSNFPSGVGGMVLGGMIPRGYGPRVWGTLPQYWHLVAATEAGGAHPTGMHSCSLICNRSKDIWCFTHMNFDSASLWRPDSMFIFHQILTWRNIKTVQMRALDQFVPLVAN